MIRIGCMMVLGMISSLVEAREYSFSDAHLHYVDFFQESDGMEVLLEKMQAARIDHVMLSGIPVAKKWDEDEPKRPRYYAGDDANAYWYSATDVWIAHAYKNLPADKQRHFHPFLSGFNPTDKNADAHIRRMLELDPGLWQGIGEIFTRHDDLTALIHGEAARANNEALARVFHLAAEYDLPVMLHSNITSKRERNPLYLPEIEESLRNHPHVRFIWAHAGTSMELHRHQVKLKFLYDNLQRMLEQYPNLYIDLSWTLLQPYLLDKNGQPDPKWVKLVSDYPKRFMLGSDVVGHFDSLEETMQGFVPFLDALPEDVARRVARDNFLEILPRNPKLQ
ncbi:amidohydrolase family protein [Ectopseudomonas mendocina]|uniref:Amidohydrolase family protein n=1 Tax=Ectopseudomonas mendocina TaxID=300 RepID=A0ABZ2RLV0_ECTME